MPRSVPKAKVLRLQAKYAKRYGVDAKYLPYLAAQIEQESGFQEGSGSPKGARDIAQFIPGTAKAYGVTLGDNRIEDDIRGQVKMMAGLLRRQGSIEKALRGYNAGEGAIDASHGYGETNGYVQRIHQLAARYKGGTAAAAAQEGTAGTPGRPAVKLPGTAGSEITSGGELDGMGLLSILNRLDSKDYDALDLARDYSALQSDAAASSTTSKLPGIKGVTIPGTKGTKGTAGAGAGGGGAGLPKGTATFDGKPVAAWIKPALEYARKHGWKGTVNEGVRSVATQTRYYNEMLAGKRNGPVAKPGTSHHQHTDYPAGAVDASDAETLSAILQRSPWRKKLQWAGAKDPPHFSHPTGGSY